MNWKRNLREYRTRGFMDILIYYGLRAIAGVIVFTLFEYCKVVVTTLQGDNTPKQKGKMLPNPLNL